jgi:copper(I)-binding protein
MDAQIHEMVMSGGNMTMQEVESIPVKAGVTITFKPGGYHVMLIGLAQPLASGGTISVTLRFAKAGDVVVAVPIQEDAPA